MVLAQLVESGFSDQIWWYTVRVTGIVSVFTISAGLITGLITSGRLLGVNPSIPWLVDLHKFFSSMTLLLVSAHLLGLYLDNFTSFTIADLLVPFHSDFVDKRLWVGLGTVAMWLLVIVDITSRQRKKMPKRLWHGIHLLVFPILIASVLHGLYIGSDSDNRVLILVSAITAALIAFLTGARIVRKLRT